MAFGRAVYNFSVVTLGMGQNITVEHTFNAVFTLMQIVLTGDQKPELGIYMSQKKWSIAVSASNTSRSNGQGFFLRCAALLPAYPVS